MKISERVGKLAPYPFVEISRIIAEKRAAGVDVVTFGVGDPDIPTPQPVLDRLSQALEASPNHRYPQTDGLPELRRAIASWHENRFGVTLDPDTEVLPLIGAKEGIGHVAFCLLDPGDLALVPDPAYTVYGVGTMFAGAESHLMPLYERNGWLPELDAIPADVARAAEVMWLTYPNNPTSAVACTEDLAEMVKASSQLKRDAVAPRSYQNQGEYRKPDLESDVSQRLQKTCADWGYPRLAAYISDRLHQRPERP